MLHGHPFRVKPTKLPRRRFLHLAAGAAALSAVSRMARAQTYPTRPVRMIVGFAAGGSADILMRLMGQWLSERLGQPFVIENRVGAGSNIATDRVAKAPADGYTLLMGGNSALVITAPIRIDGSTAPGLAIACSPAVGTLDFRIVYVAGGGNLTLNDLTILGGLDDSGNGGGGVLDFGTATLTNDTFTGNSADLGGGRSNFATESQKIHRP